MWLWSSVFVMLFTTTAFASLTFNAQIHDIDYGHSGEETLLLLTTGHVVRFNHHQKSFSHFEKIKNSRTWLEFTLDQDHNLLSVQTVSVSSDRNKSLATAFQDDLYEPTIIEGMKLAQDIFRTGRYLHKESQCYNRAHIWSYEWFTKHAVNSNKSWLFFTRKYIRKFKFEWWFHVAPSVKVSEAGVVKEKIMDLKYARGPIDVKRWTDIFMQNDAPCPLVEKYSDYANYPESAWCFTMRTSMFYYQPYDMEMKENWGSLRGNWHESDIRAAYLEAFDETF